MDASLLLSATQISLFAPKTGCQRKWAFKYLGNVEVPKHPGALLGTEVQDEQIDPYLLTGRRFDFTKKSGEIALAISALLPPPMTPGMQLRRKFVIPSPSGRFGYRGEFDLWAPSSSVVPGLAAMRAPGDEPAPLLQDIKTTGNLDYALTTEGLRTDVQAELYGAATMYLDNVDVLDAVWTYGRTRKPYRVFNRYLRMYARDVFEQFERIDEIGRELVTIRQSNPKSANELPPNPRMCDAYGGCPYRHLCNLSPAVQAAAVNVEAIEMSATSDFLAGLRKQTGAPAPAPAPQTGAVLPYAPAPAPAAPPPGHFIVHAAGSASPLQPGVHPLPPAAPPAAAPLSTFQQMAVSAAAAQGVPAGDFVPTGKPIAINPPESALPPAPPVGVAAPVAAEAPKKRGRPAKAASEPTAATGEPESSGIALESVRDLADFMRENGIKRLGFDGAAVTEIEVAT